MPVAAAAFTIAAALLLQVAPSAEAHAARSDDAPAAGTAGPVAPGTIASERRIRGRRVTVLRHADPVGSFDPSPPPPPPASTRGRNPFLAANCRPVHTQVDDDVNFRYPADTAVIKVVYAYPRDVGNRLDKPVFPDAGPQTASDRIQRDAKSMFDFVAAESGGIESIRLDVGTAIGPDCLDIQTVALPRTTAEYRVAVPDPFHAIQKDVAARLGDQPGVRNFLVYADGIADPKDATHQTAGVAEQIDSDSPDGSTSHNLGGLWAIIFNFFEYNVPLHEVTHTLGAVQPSAPHGTEGRHCRDGFDVMCYDDGFGGVSVVCGAPYSQQVGAWDCNKDDYYNPAPPLGSYLATHWNVHRSVFMCPLAQCAPSDRTAPAVEIDAGPEPRSRAKNARFRFSASEASTFRCAIDTGRETACDVDRRAPYVRRGAFAARRLDPGRHRFRVWATDAAGNQGKARLRFVVLPGRRS